MIINAWNCDEYNLALTSANAVSDDSETQSEEEGKSADDAPVTDIRGRAMRGFGARTPNLYSALSLAFDSFLTTHVAAWTLKYNGDN